MRKNHWHEAVLAIAVVLTLPAAGALAAGPLRPVAGDDATYAVELVRDLLGRRPGPAELARTLGELRAAPYRIAVHNRLLDSPEFARRVSDGAFVVGLYRQLQGRAPLAHELLLGLRLLGEGVPRSNLLGQLLHAGDGGDEPAPGLLRMYDSWRLRFPPDALAGYERDAASHPARDAGRLRSLLEGEARELGGTEAAPPSACGAAPGPEPVYDVYYGYLHAHTSVSYDAQIQGSEGPFAAFEYARDVAGLDFLGLSDHAEFISRWLWDDEWRLLADAVTAYNADGSFVALRGFEYSNPFYGHLNVFDTPSFVSTFTALTLHQFYAWLGARPQAVATFNHPGQVDWLGLEFLHLEHFPVAQRQMMGIELLTHNAQYAKYSVGYVTGDGLGHLDEALQSGWRVGSVSAQDNHSGGWGTIDDYRTGVLATQLTQGEILDALRARRFFSTQDRNLSLSFRADGREMGACLPPGAKTFRVSLADGDGEGFASIALYANGALVEQRPVSGSGAWDFEVPAPPARSYYYVLVTQDDGDQAMSAPIWVGP